MSRNIVCKRFLVAGKVQGVFFRASTAREARRLGLSGAATNLPDGRVEVVARGAHCDVDELGTWLMRGPPMANVTAVDMQELRVGNEPDDEGFRTG